MIVLNKENLTDYLKGRLTELDYTKPLNILPSEKVVKKRMETDI